MSKLNTCDKLLLILVVFMIDVCCPFIVSFHSNILANGANLKSTPKLVFIGKVSVPQNQSKAITMVFTQLARRSQVFVLTMNVRVRTTRVLSHPFVMRFL